MHYIGKRAISFIFFTGVYHFTTNAQLNIPKYEFGLSIGTYVYQGDLTPDPAGSFRNAQPGVNIHGSKIVSRSFSLRANLSFSNLHGDDAAYQHPAYRQQRNFNFSSPLFELSGLLVWSPLRKNYDDKGFSPYLFGGVGAAFLHIKRDWSNFNAHYFGETSDIPQRLAVDAAHPLPNVIPVVPVGIGLRYNLSSRLAVNAESSYRFIFTDYLDGFSVSANPGSNDHYHSTSIGVIYRIGKKNMLDCPVVR